MTIKEVISTARRIIPYRYNVPSTEVRKAQDTVWQAAKDGNIKEKTTGRWKCWDDTLMCSECGYGYFPDNRNFIEHVGQKRYIAKFCANCGADMTMDCNITQDEWDKFIDDYEGVTPCSEYGMCEDCPYCSRGNDETLDR